MTNRFTKAALAATFATAAFASTGAHAATATATARAQILQQLTVTRTADLDYATIVTGAAASTVVVTPGGVRTCGVGLVCTGTATAAAFNASARSGGNTMSSTLVSSTALMTLAAVNNFQVGGTLSVGASQADGAYAGVFTVTVNYQ